MSKRTMKVTLKPLAAVATVLHDGTNSMPYPQNLEGFLVQAHGGDVYFGDSTVSGESDGFKVTQGDTINILGFLSRGSPYSYDMAELYYIGGPWKIIIEETV